MVLCLRSVLGFLLCTLVMCANNWIHFSPVVVFVWMHFTLPHYHHFADASEGIELLKYLSGSFCRVSKIKSILSILFHSIHAALSIQLTHFSYDDCENMCTLSHFHHQIGIMTHCHCLGLGHETMACTVCLSIFLCKLCQVIWYPYALICLESRI